MTKLAISLAILAVIAGCGRPGVELRVENNSLVPLEDVSAHGRGFEAYVGRLAPGQHSTITIFPRSEAGVSLSFSASGKKFTSAESGYFEAGAGYNVTAVVTTDLGVKVESTGGP